MRVAIVGAGAVGGFLGTRLAQAGGCELSALARGATLEALSRHGWRMDTAAGRVSAPARAADQAKDLGVQDVVFFAVKGPAMAQAAESARALIGPQTLVVPAMNGVPWWFCAGVEGMGSEPLESVDPGGLISKAIQVEQVLACVVYASTSTSEPGLVQHKMGQGLIVGEPFGGHSDRAQRVTDLLLQAGFEATHSERIRYDIWYKLWGNLTMNPVSAITGATTDKVLDDPLVREFCSPAMREASAVGARIGCAIDQHAEDRHVVTAKWGAFKTSMLQDAEAGRAIELDALVGAVREIGVRLGEPTPNIDALMGLTRLFGQVKGLYPIPA